MPQPTTFVATISGHREGENQDNWAIDRYGNANFNGSVTIAGAVPLTLGSMTKGSVLFAGTNGTVSQSNNGFFYNPITSDLLIGSNVDVSVRLCVSDQYAKNADLSGGNHDVVLFGSANSVAVNDLALALRLGPSPTAANRYMSIQSYEHSVGPRDLKIQDSGGLVGMGLGQPTPLASQLTVKDTLSNADFVLFQNTNPTVGTNFGTQIIGGTNTADYGLRVRQAVSPFIEGLTVTGAGNVSIGAVAPATGSASSVLAIKSGAAPVGAITDTVQIYNEDVTAGNAVLSVFQEMAPYSGIAVASTTKIPMRVNGTTYYVLATTVA